MTFEEEIGHVKREDIILVLLVNMVLKFKHY